MISKKRLLEIEKQRKEKLYNRGSGRRNGSDGIGRIGILSAAVVLLLGAGFLVFYFNTITPVQQESVETMEDVDVTEGQKEVGVVEELEVQLHPALKKKAEEGQKEQEEVNLTFYDNLSNTESSPLTIEGLSEPQPVVEEVRDVSKAPDVKEKKTIVKSVLQQPEEKESSKPVVSATRDFRIQVSSFRAEEEAIRRKNQLVDDGFNATTETIDLGAKGVWHRVYVEDYASRNDAKSDLEKIAKKYHTKPFIVKKP